MQPQVGLFLLWQQQCCLNHFISNSNNMIWSLELLMKIKQVNLLWLESLLNLI